MPHRLTKIYTRKGDTGYTTLGSGQVSKDDLLVEAAGSLDELNSSLGLVIALAETNQKIAALLTSIQNDLFDMGGELHQPDYQKITAEKISWLEQELDDINSTLPVLKEFVLPQGNLAAAACHLARTICRRAERATVRLHRQVPLANAEILRYLNRLSDLLFVIARLLSRQSQLNEKMWEHSE